MNECVSQNSSLTIGEMPWETRSAPRMKRVGFLHFGLFSSPRHDCIYKQSGKSVNSFQTRVRFTSTRNRAYPSHCARHQRFPKNSGITEKVCKQPQVQSLVVFTRTVNRIPSTTVIDTSLIFVRNLGQRRPTIWRDSFMSLLSTVLSKSSGYCLPGNVPPTG
jgi:hypothetical protein